MKSPYTILFVLLALSFNPLLAKVKVHTDHIFIKDKQAYIDMFFQSDTDATFTLGFECVKKAANKFDEIRIAIVKPFKIHLSKGSNKIQINLSDRRFASVDESFFNVVRKYETLPVGEYEFKLRMSGDPSTEQTILRSVDTLLNPASSFAGLLKESIDEAGKSSKNTEINTLAAYNKLDKLLNKKGLIRQSKVIGQDEYMFISADGWLLGSYPLSQTKAPNRISKLKDKVSETKEDLVQNGLENYESIFSQIKKDKKKEEKFMTGQIGVTANMGNQQDAFSEQEKNFYEVHGNIDLPIMDIPVSIAGYYTTQDNNRKVKSSFIHFHYDAGKAKEKLMKLISGYKGQYEQVAAKGQGLDGTYKNFLHSLKAQKETLFYQLLAQTGIKDHSTFVDQEAIKNGEFKIDTTQLLLAMMSKAEKQAGDKNVATVQKSRDSVKIVYSKVMKKYAQLQSVHEKYEKYNTLLNQYKNTAYFDSLLAYDKIKDLNNYEDMSYKDIAKSASSLLPEGKVKKWTTGITSLDIGMFSKYSSKYTLGGQQIKGIDVGYDIGFATTQLTTGKTEYIGRAGEIDRYTFYSGGLKFKPVLKQQLELIYYGYSPSKRMFNDNREFFKNIDTDMPTFKNPVHIYSLKHVGSITKYIHTESEIALSSKKTSEADGKKISMNDRLAYNVSVEGDIPKTGVTLLVAYEHTGKDFENNTLPFSFIGTDRLKVGSRMSFFKNYINLGLEYNYLLQKNIAHTFTNTRWGFDIKTQSKRYPNIAVSYKPFSTYRSFADTLGIPQRPMFGQVWTGKASYQLRKDKNVFRFMLMYNNAGNQMDTTQLKNEMFQFSFYFMNAKGMSNVSVSKMNFTSNSRASIPAWHLQNSYMVSVGQSYSLKKNVTISGGLDFGISRFGLSSVGGNGGAVYRSPKTKLTYRLNARYMQYKLAETNTWQQVIRGTLDVTWQFRYKLNDLDKSY